LRGSFVPFVIGVLLTVVAVFVVQSLSPGTLAQFLVKLPAFDPWTWLGAQMSAFAPWSWLSAHVSALDQEKWFRDHAAELTGIGALAAGIGLFVAAMGLRVSANTSKWISSRDCLWRFNKEWKNLYETWGAAEKILETMPPTYVWNKEVGDVLNFFDRMAFMGNRGHLDDELAWTNYFDDAHDFWKLAAGYILWRQRELEDLTVWCEYGPWVQRLAKVDARHKKKANRNKRKRPELKVPVSPTAPSGMPAGVAPQLSRVVTPAARSATPSETPAQETTVAKTSGAEAPVAPMSETSADVPRAAASDLHAVDPAIPGTEAATKGASDAVPPASLPSASQADHPPPKGS
jgi:hypothetical protein